MLMEFLDFDGSGFVEAQELIDFLEDQVHRGPVPGPASMAVLHATPRRDVPRLALTLSGGGGVWRAECVPQQALHEGCGSRD